MLAFFFCVGIQASGILTHRLLKKQTPEPRITAMAVAGAILADGALLILDGGAL